MQRHILGICALVLLAGAVAFQFWPPESNSSENMLYAACTRVGPLCVVFWIAYPDLVRLPAWLWSVLPVSVVIVALRPKWAIIIIPLVIALLFLGRKKKPNPRSG